MKIIIDKLISNKICINKYIFNKLLLKIFGFLVLFIILGGDNIAELKNRLLKLKVNKKSIWASFILFVFLISVIPVSAEATANETANSTPCSTYTFERGIKGDVNQNPEIRNNVPKTDFSNQIIEMQKQGSTIVQFGNGTGNKLLIWSGIHGNEEEANIATMKYIEYLKEYSKTNALDGTLYIVPFAIPRDTAMNSRDFGPIAYTYTDWVPYKKGWQRKAVTKWYKKSYRYKGKRYYKWVAKTTYKRYYGWLYKPVTKTGYRYEDPNRIANIPNTPGWNAVEFARIKGIDHILDVHSGGGLTDYANGVIYATPGWSEETKWGNYITSQTGAPVEYGYGEPGMVRIQGHNYGINTITLEVERDKGDTYYWANKEYNMITAACQYLFSALK